jgi:hypothetical protein
MKKYRSRRIEMSFIYYTLILLLTYLGPAYAGVGIQQNEEHENFSYNDSEVGELPSGKIKVFVDRRHTMSVEVDKQDCDVLKKRDSSIGLGFKFGGLMWGFGPEIKVGHSIGVAWKQDVQRMVAEYQELCSRFNTGRVSQEEYQHEKDQIIKRGYNYAKELEERFRKKKADMFREMDKGKYIYLQQSHFFEDCCYQPKRQQIVQQQQPRRYVQNDIGLGPLRKPFFIDTYRSKNFNGNLNVRWRFNNGFLNINKGW